MNITTKKIVVISAVVLALAITSLWVIALAIDIYTGEYSFRRSFNSIKIGMSESQVLEILRNPDESSTKFHLGQYEHFEENYKRAELSGSKQYLYWNRGNDTVYVVGIDKNTKLLLTYAGGT